MSNLAFETDGIPVVADATARGIRFPAPLENQRVHNLATSAIERWSSGAWIEDFSAGWPRVLNVLSCGAVGDGVVDDTDAIQEAVDAASAGDVVFFPTPSVRYRITSAITVSVAGVTVCGAGLDCEVRQVTANTECFKATSVARLTFRNISTYGEGSWSSGWTGNEGHNDRGIHLTNCSDFLIENTRHRNHALAGIALRGSCSGEVRHPKVEGTHSYSTPLSSEQNFQMGLFITYGPSTEAWGHIRVTGGDYSGTNQGILVERGAAASTGNVEIIAPYCHDIPGQHGLYIQAPNVQVVAPKVRTTGLGGCKVQTGLSAVSDITNVSITEADFSGCAGNGFELGGLDDTYYIRNVRMSGRSTNCDRVLSVVGLVDDVIADLSGQTTTGHGVFIGDSSSLVPNRVRVRFVGRDIAKHGVYVTSASASGIEVEPDLLNVGSSATDPGTYNGVLIEGAMTDVTILNPRIVDTGTDMLYGIFASNAANLVKVFGRCVISGYTAQAVRATGRIIEFPESADIGATVTVGYTDQSTVRSTTPVRRAIRSTTASDVTLFSQTLDDEGAYCITAEIVGKLSGSAQRRCSISNVLVYRDGGGATIEGTADEVANTQSGSFAGVYAWDASGNNVRLRVNSGGTANYDWSVRVSVTKLVGELA